MNRNLTTVVSSLTLATGIWLTMCNTARADHSLANAMSDSATIAQAISRQLEKLKMTITNPSNSVFK